ncbi:MAG: beta-lactamase family protein [Pirellulaceae bacterium]|nr:beta-lactamase family protein [Pirellulaceae bacterium]
MASFDRMATRFLAEHGVPGMALAVTDGSRLVYARGFGLADTSSEEPVTPTSLFRIASVSKPITAIAALQLVQDKRLRLDDRVVEIVPIEPFVPDGASRDARWNSVTVRHLLEHRGGWDRDQSFDPMFQAVRCANALGVEPPAEPAHIIRWMLGQPLDFEPGERYAYSNFGYCLMGRAIEAAAGQDYESYVKEHVLAPLGIRSMRIGSTRSDQRAPNEVCYYHPGTGRSVFADDLNEPCPHPYGAWHLEAMDAHGGWIASAVDLARLAVALDHSDRCKILSDESIRTMYGRPGGRVETDPDGTPSPVYYSCGWSNRIVAEGKFNRWHAGSLPGTTALLVRRHDGRNWAVLCNASIGKDGISLVRAVDPLIHAAAREVSSWPEHDLFDNF